LSASKQKQVEQSLLANEGKTSQDEDPELRFPVYLNRNKRIMKAIRKDAEDATLTSSNGLVLRQVPHIKKLFFEPDTSDFLVYKRKTQLNLEEDFLKSYKTSVRFKQVLAARRMKIEESAKNSPTSANNEQGEEVSIQVDLQNDANK
jgi:hypothetical protein